MRFATYGRKSVYSDKSDSVDNQERMCREYADLKFSGQIDSFEVYQDEGFTGANTDRPGLERLMEDVKDGLLDALIVYQLDRISRDVRDFSNIYALLEERHVMFISIKENIDTATPIGKAMMYVTMVFAQMERETIANRVTDNMNGLAKKGLWPIGTVPTGYVRKHITLGGKKHSTLEIEPEGAAYVRGIYEDFLSSEQSVRALATRYRNEGKKTLNGCFLPAATLYRILTTPTYCAGTAEAYDYWDGLGCQMDADSPREMWDGSRAVMVYGRRRNRNKNAKFTPKEEWMVCLGLHQPLIKASDWLAVQEKFSQNTFSKEMKYEVPLLKGVLRCARCGGGMSVARKKNKSGVWSAYFCLKRSHQGSSACDMPMIRCGDLDDEVVAIFRRIEADQEVVRQYAARSLPQKPAQDTSALERRIAAQASKIERLAASLAEAENSTAQKYIVAEIERQDLNLAALKRELGLAKAESRRADAAEKSLEERAKEIGNLVRAFDSLSDKDRNSIVREVVKECTWDGETLFLSL